MLESSIVPILVVSGAVTAGGGLAAVVALRTLLRLGFGVDAVDAATAFFARHWGVLIFAVGAMTVWSAYVPASRPPILIAAIVEKLAIVALIFFGGLKRTVVMTAIASTDFIFSVVYLIYLVGTRM